jgi:hypothetical protein
MAGEMDSCGANQEPKGCYTYDIQYRHRQKNKDKKIR